MCLSGCKNTAKSSSSENTNSTNVSSKITDATLFSEDCALVIYEDEKDTVICIDKKGTEQFRFNKPEYLISSYGSIEDIKCINGLFVLNDSIYDKKGTVTSAQSLGITTFYSQALESGYILASVINNDDRKLGILNSKLEWVVEPNSELYWRLADHNGDLAFSSAIDLTDYTYQNYLYFYDLKLYLNLTNGEITSEAPFSMPSFAWVLFVDCGVIKYQDNSGNTLLQMENNNYDESDILTGFDNGKSLISMRKGDKWYFTLIDESGKQQFSPVEMEKFEPSFEEINGITYSSDCEYEYTNGTILLKYDYGSKGSKYITYNENGEKLGTFETDKTCSAKMNDGIINITQFDESGFTNVTFCDNALNVLF